MQKKSVLFSLLLASAPLCWSVSAQAEPLPQLPESEAEPAEAVAAEPSEAAAAVAAPSAGVSAEVGPGLLPYDGSRPVPAGYTLIKRTRTGLVIGGALTAGIPYLITAMVGGGAQISGAKWGWTLMVPVAGPLLVYPVVGPSHIDLAGTMLLLGSFVAQGAGTAMIIAGLVAKEKTLVRNDLLMGALGDNVRLLPTAGRDSAGLTLLGTF